MAKKRFCKVLVVMILVLSLVGTEFPLFHSEKARADMIPCSTCGGSGKTICTSCGGQGMKSCTMCGGTGGSMQSVYGGIDPITGMMKTSQMWVSCSGCGGSGRSMCFSCNGSGRSNCYRCGGTGMVVGSSSGGSSSGGSSSSDELSHQHSSDSEGQIISQMTAGGVVLEATPGVVSNEGGLNLLDGDQYTKFNFIATSGYIIWEAPEQIKVKSYVLMTANDTALYTGRNPRSWVLYGSNENLSRDSDKWKKIHEVENDTVLEPKNYTEYTFKLDSTAKAYKYYKLEILDNQGDPCTQLSELILNGTTVTATSKATTLSSVKLKDTSLKVKWKKKSGVTGYQIQYSTSSKFKNSTEITIEGADNASKTIKNLESGKKYYVRVRTYKTVNGETVYSKWSKKKVAGS